MMIFFLASIETQEDRDLFIDLYTKYKNFMFNTANRILHDHDMSEDIVHDALVRLLDTWGNYDLQNGHKSRRLIGNIVDGLAKNAYNRRNRNAPLEEISAITDSFEEQVIGQEQYEELKVLIRQLDPIYAEAILLKFDSHYNNREIAEFIGITEDVVRQRLHRGREKLKTLLAREGRPV